MCVCVHVFMCVHVYVLCLCVCGCLCVNTCVYGCVCGGVTEMNNGINNKTISNTGQHQERKKQANDVYIIRGISSALCWVLSAGCYSWYLCESHFYGNHDRIPESCDFTKAVGNKDPTHWHYLPTKFFSKTRLKLAFSPGQWLPITFNEAFNHLTPAPGKSGPPVGRRGQGESSRIVRSLDIPLSLEWMF